MAIAPNYSTSANGSIIYSHVNVNGTVYSVPTNIGTTTVKGDYRNVNSVSTPGWGKSKGWKHWNPYSKEEIHFYDPPGTFQIEYNDTHGKSVLLYQGWNAAAAGCWYVLIDSDSADDPTQKVIAKLQEQLRLDKTNSLTTLAEFGKTADHLAKTAKRFYDALRALKKGELGEFSRAIGVTTSSSQKKTWTTFHTNRKVVVTGDGLVPIKKRGGKNRFSQTTSSMETNLWNWMADTWLEYSYAWKPLLFDLYKTTEALANVVVEKGDALRVASAKSRIVRHGQEKSEDVNFRRFAEWRDEKRVSMKVWYKIEQGENNAVNVFGLNNPMAMAWEVIPFSFVADWFLPIGQALEALTAYQGLTFVGGTKTYVRITHIDHNYSGKEDIPYPAWTGTFTPSGSGGLTNDSFVMQRTGLPTFPAYGWPKFKDPRSVSHALSAVALLQSIFLQQGGRSTLSKGRI